MKNTINDNINLTIEEKAWILSMRKITPAMAPTLEKYPTLENFLQEIGLPKNVSFDQGESTRISHVYIKEGEAYLEEDKIYKAKSNSKRYLLPCLDWEATVKGIFGSNMPLILDIQIHHGRVIYAAIHELDYEIRSNNLSGPNGEYCPQVAEMLFKNFKKELDKAISQAEEDVEECQSCLKDAKQKLRDFRKMKERFENKQ